jgi:hypothetical protein
MKFKETTMKRIIQAAVVASLLTGAQAALAFPSSGDDYNIPQVQSTYADRFAGEKAAPAMTFPADGEESNSVVAKSTYADRHAGEIAQAPMVFPSSGDDVVIWAGTTRAERLAAGASDPALSK